MKSTPKVVPLVLAAVVLAATGASQATPPQGPRYAPGVVLVEYKGDASANVKNARRERARINARKRVGAIRAARVSPRAVNLEKLHLPPGKTVEAAIKELAKDPNVRFAEPDYVLTKAVDSNDPYYTGNNLWGMYGNATSPANQFGSQAGEAWAQGYTGSRDVYVGVIDEGIDVSHPDLAANIWVNPHEIPNDGIDNDGNGYVDDVHGWDFYNNDKSVYDGNGEDTHGTHVAGTIGGLGGNGAGVAGVNWQITMISLKFLDTNGGYTSGAIAAVDYLNDLKTRHGLNIIASSNSWGGGGFSQALLDAINRGGNRDIMFIAAAGNDSSSIDGSGHYPASYQCTTPSRNWDCVISVASITSSGALSSFSNHGAVTVDIGAPGSGINSTLPGNTYGSYSGTSMATPHVSGAAALCKSMNPSITASEIRSALLSSATATSSLSGKTVTGGRLDVGALADVCAVPADPVDGAPGNLAAVADSATAISLSWSDNATNESYFEVQQSPAGCGSFNTVATLGANTTAYRADDLQAETEYCFRVRAGNSYHSQSAWSATAAATTEAPPPPYQCAATPYGWVSLGSATSLGLGDEGQGEVNMPFSVPFYGTTTSRLTISPNGLVRLDGGSVLSAYSNTGLPAASEPNGLVAVFWDDLNQGAGGSIRTGTVGSAPNRRYVVSWEGIPHYSVSGSNASFQLVIEEATGDFVMNYADVVFGSSTYDYGRSATVGVENQTGTEGVQHVYNQAALLDGTAVRCSTGEIEPVPQAPAAPTGFSGNAVSGTQINLSWGDVADETSYVLERAIGTTDAFTVLATLSANTASYSDTTVSSGTTYRYRLLAANANGNSAYSGTVSVTTPAALPAAPGSISATASSRRVTVSWTDASENESGFDVGRATFNKRRNTWGSITTVTSVGANVTTLIRSSESKGTHRYYVRSKNSAGSSSWTGPTANIVVR